MSTDVCNILIVDDEPSNLLALEAILEPLGHRLVRAASGVEALKLALKMEFAVVLLDVQMPEMDGFETAQLLRKRPRTRDLPIIFLTAISKERSFVERGYEVGGVDYLFKPYDPDALRGKVVTFVELAQKNAKLRAAHVGELADLKQLSEKRYEFLADAMPQIVWTSDASGAINYYNRQWAELVKEPDFTAIIHPDDLATFSSGWTTAIRSGTEWEAELRLGSKTRGYRFYLVRALPRDFGGVMSWVGTATDIDARVRADRALRLLADASQRLSRSFDEPRELQAVLEMALPTLGDAAVLDLIAESERFEAVAGDGDRARLRDPRFELGPTTVAYSGRPELFLGIEKQDGSSGSEREPQPSGRGAEHLRFLRELGVTGYMCIPLTTRAQTIGTLSLLRFHGRYEEADAGLATDLAQRIAIAIENARLHTTTEKRREELELANKSKDIFLATLSHELRTPLNAIVGWTEMMKNGSLSQADVARAMETIDRNAHALSNLVADLLDVSRIVTGALKIEPKPVALAAVMEAAVLAARPQAAGRGIALTLDVHDPGHVMGDEGRLRQIVGNLLSNAIKFTPEGGTIAVKVSTAGGRMKIAVTDSGHGITPEFLPHVFERFRQGEKDRAKGLGLGLAIVKHLVEEHGGTVIAESEGNDKGSTFTIDLPLVTSDELPVSVDSLEDTPSTEERGEPNLTGIHVLIVEDDPDGNELVCAILERYGARVTSAMTAGDALAALESEMPNILVSDIGLPDMDGMQLIRTVREKHTLPAVALTAYASRQDATKAISAGFDEHITKPVQPASLGAAILRLLARDNRPSTAPSASSSSAA